MATKCASVRQHSANLDDLQDDLRVANDIAKKIFDHHPPQPSDKKESGKWSKRWSKMQDMSIAMLAILAKQSPQLVAIPVQSINSTISTEVTNQITHFMKEFVCPTNTDFSMDYVKQCIDPDNLFYQMLLKCLNGKQKQLVTDGKLLEEFKDPMNCLQNIKDMVITNQTKFLTAITTGLFIISMANLVCTVYSSWKTWQEIDNMTVEGQTLPALRAALSAIDTRIENNLTKIGMVMDAFKDEGILPEPLVLQKISSEFQQIKNELDFCLIKLKEMEFNAAREANTSRNSFLRNTVGVATSVAWGIVTFIAPVHQPIMTAVNVVTGLGFAGAAGAEGVTYYKASNKLKEIGVEITRVGEIEQRLRESLEHYDSCRPELQELIDQQRRA